MRHLRISLFSVLISVGCGTLLAQDLKVDPDFNPGFTSNDRVESVLVLSNGQILVAGAICGSSGTNSCLPLLRRLNANGSIDATFAVDLGTVPGEGSFVNAIYQLPNGQFFISGKFSYAGERINYLRLNADGSVDTSMTPAWLGFVYGTTHIRPTTGGKYVACTGRTINDQNYNIAHRINADGSPDPTFRITFVDGFCRDLQTQADGKVLINIGTEFGQPEVKALQRLNADGSKDLSFDADIPTAGSYYGGPASFLPKPDGGVLMSHVASGGSNTLRHLAPDGSTVSTISNCGGYVFLPRSDGTLMATACKRWSGTSIRASLARVFPDNSVDSTLDEVYLSSGVLGLQEAGNDGLYVYGRFQSVGSNTARRKLVRLIPDNSPFKAKFDFDGDGRSDLAIFRPSDGTWYIHRSTEGPYYQQWGFPTDALAAGHYDNDGRTDIGIFRDGILHAYSPAFNHRQIYIGQSGDIPFLANFVDNGLNLGDFVVRGVRSGSVQWAFRSGSTAESPSGTSFTVSLPGELASDTPVIGDFNADSLEEIGYFRDGVWYTHDLSTGQMPQTMQWGIAGDIPVPGDYDGDRQTDYAVFRPSTGVWWIRLSSGGFFILNFGQNGDIPVPADYDGDGKVDVAIFRDGQWWQYRSGTWTVHVENWGIAGDKPIPAQHQ